MGAAGENDCAQCDAVLTVLFYRSNGELNFSGGFDFDCRLAGDEDGSNRLRPL